MNIRPLILGKKTLKLSFWNYCLEMNFAFVVKVYVGVDDLNYEHDDETKKFLVDFIISHRDGYQGS